MGDGLAENGDHALVKATDLGTGQALRAMARPQARPPQDFVRIDISDTCHHILVEQQCLECPSSAPQEPSENGGLQPSATRSGLQRGISPRYGRARSPRRGRLPEAPECPEDHKQAVRWSCAGSATDASKRRAGERWAPASSRRSWASPCATSSRWPAPTVSAATTRPRKTSGRIPTAWS